MKLTSEMREWRKEGLSCKAMAAKLRVSPSSVERAFKRDSSDGKAAGRSLSEFRSTYDKATIIPAKVKEALKSLGTGWEYEVQFAKLAGVSLADLGAFRDQFAPHVVSLREGRRAWAGTAATAKQMREML